jgi:hypothetical protein
MILIKEKNLFILFEIQITQILTSKKINYWSHGFTFSPSLQQTFNVLHIHVMTFEIVQFSIYMFFNMFLCVKGCLKNMQVTIIINLVI